MSVQLEALDILGDLLSRFGGLLVSYHQSIQAALLPQLTSARLAVRKRTIMALGKQVILPTFYSQILCVGEYTSRVICGARFSK